MTVLSSQYSSSPTSPQLRPMPLPFTPLNGISGDTPLWVLTHDEPDSSRCASCSPLATSLVHTEPPKPYSVPFACARASSTSLKGMIGSTGPNCSSSTSRTPLPTPVMMVGG